MPDLLLGHDKVFSPLNTAFLINIGEMVFNGSVREMKRYRNLAIGFSLKQLINNKLLSGCDFKNSVSWPQYTLVLRL